MKKKVYIRTFGCQMNENDSQQMAALLGKDQYELTARPFDADLILVNTCSVREKSYHKAMSAIGAYHKDTLKPSVQIGVTGCVASQEGARIAERFPSVDFVLGTDQLHRINEAVRHSQSVGGVFVAAEFQDLNNYRFPLVDWSAGDSSLLPVAQNDTRDVILSKAKDLPIQRVTAYVTIMKGCDNTCAFCIVPMTRGPEVSRPSADILQEIQTFQEKGVREITLLGQNVNSYGKRLPEQTSFAELLRTIAKRTRIARLRFTSPHPKDLSRELIEEYRSNRTLCRHIHLPVQSGSSRILKRMRRAHTRETYLRRIASLRRACPEVAITTDIIVGFPGETEADFEETLSLVREVGFDGSYSFAYSERPGTEAVTFGDDVPPAEKARRLHELQALQKEISLKINRQLIGQAVEVLVEGPAKKPSPLSLMMGRTTSNRIVNFVADPSTIGAILKVKVARVSPYALYGEVV